ncbi:proximal sequence element A Pbp49 isoform X1 [Tachypleus tridentatus]|uniref:proximal sequence element A Pbp49 isoform X1 n=2 Tax=Tachypleus tridentatus TaxID=6853 RepID=UPI003FCF4ADA
MESIHEPYKRAWISNPINVKRFYEHWCESLFENETENVTGSKMLQKLVHLLQLPDHVVKNLETECGPKSLTCEGEVHTKSEKATDISEGVELMTLRIQKGELEKRKNDVNYKKFVYDRLKVQDYPERVCLGGVTNSQSKKISSKVKLSMLSDVLLTVQIFRPVQIVSNQKYRGVESLLVDQEVAVLGQQKLTQLRDSIGCVSDIAVPGDFSENPNFPPELRAEDLYKSGFFYINGVFYNDMRNTGNRDYSRQIRAWAETVEGVGPFTSKNMEDCQFMDLDLRLGYPYVYVHQGFCEHLIVFSDLRLCHPDDSQDICDYPMYLRTPRKQRIICMVCHIKTSRWVTFGNKRVPEDPFFFCENCFFKYNYTADGKKIGDFEAHLYFDRTAIF